MKDIGVFEDVLLWASSDGKLVFTAEGQEDYHFHISGHLRNVFMINRDEVFLVFEGSKTFLFNRNKYLNWKRNYLDIQILLYHPASQLICYQQDQKFFHIGQFIDGKLSTNMKIKASLFNKNCVKVSHDLDYVLLLNDMVISIISLKDYTVAQKIYLQKIMNDEQLVVSDADFLDSQTVCFISSMGDFYLMDFIFGTIVYEYHMEEQQLRLYQILHFSNNFLFTQENKVFKLEYAISKKGEALEAELNQEEQSENLEE